MKCVVAMYNASANGEYTLSIPSKQWDFQVGNVSVQINGCVTLFENIRNKWRDIYIYMYIPATQRLGTVADELWDYGV